MTSSFCFWKCHSSILIDWTSSTFSFNWGFQKLAKRVSSQIGLCKMKSLGVVTQLGTLTKTLVKHQEHRVMEERGTSWKMKNLRSVSNMVLENHSHKIWENWKTIHGMGTLGVTRILNAIKSYWTLNVTKYYELIWVHF